MKKIIKIGAISATFLAPLALFAAVPNTSYFTSLLSQIQVILGYIVPILIALAVIYFLFGVLKYVISGGDPEKRAEGRNIMIWGIIAIFVMVSVWGLVRFLQNLTGVDTSNSSVPAPQVPKF
jgi:hypothetical protein